MDKQKLDLMESTAELLTAEQTAKILNVSVGYLAQMRMGIKPNTPDLPFFKMGKSVRYKKADILEYINKNTKTTNKE